MKNLKLYVAVAALVITGRMYAPEASWQQMHAGNCQQRDMYQKQMDAARNTYLSNKYSVYKAWLEAQNDIGYTQDADWKKAKAGYDQQNSVCEGLSVSRPVQVQEYAPRMVSQ